MNDKIVVITYVPATEGVKVGFTVNSVRLPADVGETNPPPLEMFGTGAPAGKDLNTVEIDAALDKEFAKYPTFTVPTI